MFELPDELWNHIKEYQLDWKKKHKKKLFKVVWEMEYLAEWHGVLSSPPEKNALVFGMLF